MNLLCGTWLVRDSYGVLNASCFVENWGIDEKCECTVDLIYYYSKRNGGVAFFPVFVYCVRLIDEKLVYISQCNFMPVYGR